MFLRRSDKPITRLLEHSEVEDESVDEKIGEAVGSDWEVRLWQKDYRGGSRLHIEVGREYGAKCGCCRRQLKMPELVATDDWYAGNDHTFPPSA